MRIAACILLIFAMTLLASAQDEGIHSRIPRQHVDSTAISAIGYSKRLHALEIEFINGAIYRYRDVPTAVYRELQKASSKARFYDDNIRGHYSSVHVRPRASDADDHE